MKYILITLSLTVAFCLNLSAQCAPDRETDTPYVRICTPLDSELVASPVHVTAVGTSVTNGGVLYMQVYVDTVWYSTFHADTIDLKVPLSDGKHRIAVMAHDKIGAKVLKYLYVYVKTPLSVTMTAPAPNSVSASPVDIAGTAKASSGISHMQVYIDGIKYGDFWSDSVVTNAYMNPGTHRVTIQAYDRAGNIAKQSVNVLVKE